MPALFKVRIPKHKEDGYESRFLDVYCVQRVLSVDPILQRSQQRTEFLVYDGRFIWENADHCILVKDET